MQLHNRKLTAFSLIVLASIVLAACAPQTVEVPVTVIVEGTPVVQIQEVTATPSPEEKTLIVCLGQEPDMLPQIGSDMLASANVREAFRDGPIDSATYAYQAVILEKLPKLADGDATLATVEITDGQYPTSNANGDVVTATAGTEYQTVDASGAVTKVTFDGSPLQVVQMTASFSILEGVSWEDGTPVTADDSVYGFELWASPDAAQSKFTTDRTTSYVADDENTVTWTGIPGWVDSTYYINFFEPYQRSVYGAMSVAELLADEGFTRDLGGWGPYQVDEWVAGDHITMSRHPYYFRAGEGLPAFDTVIYKFLAADVNLALAQLLSGQCDIGTQEFGFESVGKLLVQAESEGVLRPYFVTGTVWEHIDFAMAPQADYSRAVGNDFFQTLEIRQAFTYCVDRQSLVDNFLFGRSAVMNTYIPADHPMYAADAATYAFDPEKGKALLEAQGWTDADGDGIREKGGVPLSVGYTSTTAALRKDQVMPAVVNMLKECGIDAQQTNLPASQWFAAGKDTPLRGMHYDLGEFAWLTGVEPGCSLYLTSEIPSDDNGWGGDNNPGYSNLAYDSACQGQLSSLDDAKKTEFAQEAQRIFAADLPVIPLFQRLKLAVSRPELAGVVIDPTVNTDLFKIEEFRIETP